MTVASTAMIGLIASIVVYIPDLETLATAEPIDVLIPDAGLVR